MSQESIRLCVLGTDGTAVFQTVPNTLDQLQALVRGSIEVFDMPAPWCDRGMIAICNEEGSYVPLPPNPFSYSLLGPPSANYGQPVVGPVLIVGDTGEEFISLTDEQEQQLMETVMNGFGRT
jgi:hypothetical protein